MLINEDLDFRTVVRAACRQCKLPTPQQQTVRCVLETHFAYRVHYDGDRALYICGTSGKIIIMSKQNAGKKLATLLYMTFMCSFLLNAFAVHSEAFGLEPEERANGVFHMFGTDMDTGADFSQMAKLVDVQHQINSVRALAFQAKLQDALIRYGR